MKVKENSENFWKVLLYPSEEDVPSLKVWWEKAYPDEQYRKWVIQNRDLLVKNAAETNTDIKSTEYRVTCKDKSIRKIIISGITLNDDFLTTLIDITERKQAEKELEESKNLFEQLFIQSSVSTQLLDNKGWCVRINPKLSELSGVKPEHIEGEKYNILHDGEINKTGVIEKLKRVFDFKETIGWEVNFDIKNDSESTGVEVSKPEKIWFKNIAYPILNAHGDLIYVIIQHEDITGQKNALDELEKHRNHLEELVKERTLQLEEKNRELQNFNDLFVGREFRIKELKDKVQELEQHLTGKI